MKKFFRIGCLAFLGMIFIFTLLFLYFRSKPKNTVYEIVTPKVKTLEKNCIVTGKIEPRDEVLIKPQISGIVTEIYKEVGQTVHKGEVIAKIKVIPELGQLNNAESRVKQAKINLEQAKNDFNRTEELYRSNLISKEEYEKSRTKYEKEKEEYSSANDALLIIKEGMTPNSKDYSSTLIRSTIDGLILDIPVKKGNSVIMSNTFNDGTTIASIANMKDLIFKGKVDEIDVGKLKKNMSIKLKIGALQDKTFSAVLEYISPKGVELNGTNQYEVKAFVQLPDTIFIRSGYSANATIVLDRQSNAITIPEKCLDFTNDSAFVYVLKSTGDKQEFEKRYIVTGISDGIDIAVTKGLSKKESVRGSIINN